MRVPEEFFNKKPGGDAHPSKNAHHSDRAEEVQWASKILEQEPDGDQVEKYTESTRDSVVRNAAFAVDITNRHFADGSAVPRSQSRNEPVQFPIERDLLQ